MLHQALNTPRWYVINTHPWQEERASNNLSAWKVETFLPKLKKRRNAQGGEGSGYKIKPMFPRYLFARFNAKELLHKVRFTRGVYDVVSFGCDPAPVEDDVVAMLRSRTGADGLVSLNEHFKPGAKVLITGGPLKNFTGVFERNMKDACRIVILLQTISYQTHVIIDRDFVEHLH